MVEDIKCNYSLTFLDILQKAERKYRSKIPEKGTSWKIMPLIELRRLLYYGEVKEWAEAMASNNPAKEEQEELLDIINVACMIATRLEAGKK